MTAIELKVQIDRELEKLPKQDLNEILNFIKKLKYDPQNDEHFNKILKEDSELLHKLAQ